jgi:hypothetical protein
MNRLTSNIGRAALLTALAMGAGMGGAEVEPRQTGSSASGGLPYHRKRRRQRLKPASGAGSIFADSEMQQLIDAGRVEDAAKLFEAHQARTHKSGAWKRSKMRMWHDYYRAGDDRARR